MKLLLLVTAFIASTCHVNAGKTQRLLAAINAGLIPGANGLVLNGVNPGLVAGGLNPAIVAGGGAGFIRQPQFAQFVPAVPAYAFPAQVPNMYPVPAVNGFPFMGAPQVPQMNPAQQQVMGVTGGAAPPQQFPPQPDPLRRFRRQIMKPDDSMPSTMDTQIPAPTDKATVTPCEDEGHRHQN